jgi:hypothetical protein
MTSGCVPAGTALSGVVVAGGDPVSEANSTPDLLAADTVGS